MSALDVVLEKFGEAGWTVAARESVGGGRSVNPSRVDLVRGKQSFSLLAYAWKITHEGKGRAGMNYRIQTTRSHEDDLLAQNGRQTVGFGVDADRQVVAVFDGWTKRATGSSSSVHIKRATLDKAAADGFAVQEPRWDSRAAARYSDIHLLLPWISEQQATRTAAVQPLDYRFSDDRAITTVVADLWDSAPAAWLRRGDLLVLANRNGDDLLDTAIWQITDLTVAVIREGRNPRRKVTFTCRRYGRVTTTDEANFLAGLTKREPAQ
ncbi:hypothetical protein [Arthrobacter sp. 4R501]|uniref:hypothetical protein n=1 Tax=Arthrobacter sp. 4R501 TaxID=2058886 RepID=UPI000CE4224D|nr:hypothetical protein [Arthrobacter sp. 4R501]